MRSKSENQGVENLNPDQTVKDVDNLEKGAVLNQIRGKISSIQVYHFDMCISILLPEAFSVELFNTPPKTRSFTGKTFVSESA